MNKKILLTIFLLVVVAILAGFIGVKAQTTNTAAQQVSGWAWSSNIGWISFGSSTNSASSNYGVYVKPGGAFDGYAWSSNIGWLSFIGSDIADCNGGSATQASVNTATGDVSGWIRALSGKGRTDGWDGCIELAGPNHKTKEKGVTFNPTTGFFNGYAWGGPVVGWIDFAPSLGVGSIDPHCCNTSGGITLSCSPTVTGSGPWNVNWNISASGGNGTYTYTPSLGSLQTAYSSAGTYTVNVSATDGSYTSAPFACSATIVGTTPNPGAVSLRLKEHTGSTYSQFLQIPQGTAFDLKWDLGTFSTTTCASRIINPANATLNNSWSDSSPWSTSGPVGGSSNNITDSSVPIGIYQFTMTCAVTGNGSVSTTTTLRITDSSINEY